ncbi:hypothetical protein C5L38_17570 [Streptomyces sp. WAC00288]|nr:hypothetical protein C5L38_17570 [Streptomyces sp. WAC00288]KYG55288.1 hypothetical protein AWI43_13270 [Streptomyces sp. WAC04657]
MDRRMRRFPRPTPMRATSGTGSVRAEHGHDPDAYVEIGSLTEALTGTPPARPSGRSCTGSAAGPAGRTGSGRSRSPRRRRPRGTEETPR